MISQDEIDAFSTGDKIMNEVEERLERGVPFQRELMTKEVRPFARAAIYWRRVALNLWDEKQRADKDSMSLGPIPEKYQETG